MDIFLDQNAVHLYSPVWNGTKSMFPRRLDSVARLVYRTGSMMKYKINLHQVHVTPGVQLHHVKKGNDVEINRWYVAGEGGL
jgi:S-adenosylmethionine:diacylglycerol 3-amino-3-carboxypropyl transferase